MHIFLIVVLLLVPSIPPRFVDAAKSDGSIDSTVKLAHETNGGPTLVNDDRYGRSTTLIGDLDGDGIEDIAVGAIGDNGERGAVYIHFMDTDGTIKSTTKLAHQTNGGPTLAATDQYGFCATPLGDLDGDGVIDLAVCTPHDGTGGSARGAVYIHFMNTDGTIKSTTKLAHQTNGGPTLVNEDLYGSGIANIGDLDGDGIIDLAVSATGDDTGGSFRGAVYVHFMNTDGTIDSTTKLAHQTNGAPTLADGDRYGFSLAPLGDLDGDGIEDLVVGAGGDSVAGDIRGAAYVHFMNTDGTIDSTTKLAHETNGGPTLVDFDQYGTSIASLGDLDGDGVTDIAITAIGDDTGGSLRGAAYVHRMNTDGTIKRTTKLAHQTNGGPTLVNEDLYGGGVTALGDLDGDGITDIAVGAYGDDTGGSLRGAVYVHFLAEILSTADNSITLSRQKVGATGVDFSLTFTLASEDTGTLEVAFPAGFTVTQAATSGTCSGGGTLDTFGFTSSTLTGTKTNCSGTVTLSGAQITNPSSAGQYTITWTNDEGSATVFIVDDDQVTVTAQVDSAMTFDLDTGTTTGNDSAAPYTVALGTLTSGSVTSSGDGTVHMIGIDVDTNATGGAVVQVKNANGADGLKSISVSADTIPAVSSTTLTAGTEGYGICVYQVKAATGTFRSAGFHNGGTLSATGNTTTSSTCDDATHQLDTGLTTSFQNILNSANSAVESGRGEVFVKAAISETTEAHDDYTDTLTFRATATF